MTRQRHSYVRFFPSDWLGGTARMTRLHRSVYFDICCYNWDKGEPVPQQELALMLLDVDNGSAIVAQLIAVGKLAQDGDGVYSPRAIEEAMWAMRQWEARSKGGKRHRPSLQRFRNANATHPPLQAIENQGDRNTLPSLFGSNNQNQNQNQNHTYEEEPHKRIPTVSCRLSADVTEVLSAWNEMAARVGIPATKGNPSPARVALIKARVKDHGVDEIVKALRAIPRGGFIGGKWAPNLDAMFKADKMTRLVEGGYGDARRRHEPIPF